ncbi:MAG: excinuclease ABC subunit UvrC [Lentisphaerae bacterium]|nr:excinuclease ABC subunit UvrC [Lentisphaerota bacterium]
MKTPENILRKLKELPEKPGCYLMRDARGTIIYVGKAASLRKRVQSYFRRATLRSGSPKLRGMVRSIADFDHVVTRNEAEAALTEGRWIKDYRPRYNISFRDDKRFLLLRADPRQVLPRFAPCRIRKPDQSVYFGPYASSSAARATLDFVEKRFGLRRCKAVLPDAETHRHCIDDVVRTCSAPCVGKVDVSGYRRRFEEACAFLRGERRSVLADLRESMRAASNDMAFERAAALRDLLLSLHATVRQRARAPASPAAVRDRAEEGIRELAGALGLPAAPRIIEAFDISNTFGENAVASMVVAEDGIPQKRRYRRFRIRSVRGIDDAAMMAEVVERRCRALDPAGQRRPDLVLVDGGLAQLGAARKVLDAMGWGDVPAAGLAKRLEEVFLAGSSEPVRLRSDSPGLLVLRRIRDEAHRFALTHHRSIRERRIRDSRLDEIPGIGETRKRLLLSRFGSVRAIRSATADELAEVAGIGRVTARMVLEGLGEPGVRRET